MTPTITGINQSNLFSMYFPIKVCSFSLRVRKRLLDALQSDDLMFKVRVGGEQIKVTLAVRCHIVSAQAVIEEAQLANDVEIQIEDGQEAAAADHVNILAIGVDAGRLTQIVAAIGDDVAFVSKMWTASFSRSHSQMWSLASTQMA